MNYQKKQKKTHIIQQGKKNTKKRKKEKYKIKLREVQIKKQI